MSVFQYVHLGCLNNNVEKISQTDKPKLREEHRYTEFLGISRLSGMPQRTFNLKLPSI